MSAAKTILAALLAAAALAISAAPASAEFGLHDLEVSSLAKDGSPAVQAGSHPYSLTTNLAANTFVNPDNGVLTPDEEAKDVVISFPPGMVGNVTAVPRCTASQFLAGGAIGDCPDASALGTARVEYGEPGVFQVSPVYNLYPSPGKVGKIGFIVEGVAPVTVDLGLNPNPPYNPIVTTSNISQGVFFLAAKIEIWGVPASSAHDGDRGSCLSNSLLCPASIPQRPFLTLPTSCEEELSFGFSADSWQNPSPPGVPYPFQATTTVNDGSVPPNPLAPSGCAKLQFTPEISTKPTAQAAESPSGLDVDVDVADEGIGNPAEGAAAASTIKKAVLTLPEGVTINPSQAEGLGTCSLAQLAEEKPSSGPGEGCPQSSKIGNVEVESPLLEGTILHGALYVATPYQNQVGSLISFYMVIKDPTLGVIVKLPAKVSPDPQTGQLITTLGEAPYEIPQLPVSHFHFHFREGGRSPLVTPATCGTYTTKTVFTPWSAPNTPYTATSSFKITSGVGGAPCPVGAPPFNPGFEAGTQNNAAGTYSPFYLRLTRADGEADMTRFSSILPPGVTGKLAGVAVCPQAAVEAAKAKSGLAERAEPSCPPGSRIGSTLTGAGVGPELTYVPGSLYLGGPYQGDPYSVVAVVPAVAGPFDVGTVVVQEALTINPETTEVEVDGAASDPIPHILAGIPLKIRDLRINVDRSKFIINPTSCAEKSVRGTLWGGGSDPFSVADDSPFALSQRFQAADCASLAFKPKLSLRLKGGTRRNDHPALIATLRPRTGDANIGAINTVLPHSEFIDPERVASPCTRPQFAAEACPPASVLGTATAYTPLLDEPLTGKVYFRSNGGARTLPDIVADVHGQGFHIVQVGFVDSVNARIRTRFTSFPDAPVEKIVLKLKGGKEGVIVNSANLCAHPRKAKIVLTGQNGRRSEANQALQTDCKAKKKAKRG
jgi:hypothetical protein